MKPKEKALELVAKYYSTFAQKLQLSESFDSDHRYSFCKPLAKECALVCVDLLCEQVFLTNEDYWKEVRKEIRKV